MPSLTCSDNLPGLTRRQWLSGAGAVLALSAAGRAQQPQYDLLLRGGHLIDPKNSINAVRDVAVLDGKVAAVAEKIDPARAFKVVDAGGLYLTPGLIDIHVHVFAGTNERGSYAGDNSLYPDGWFFYFRRRRLEDNYIPCKRGYLCRITERYLDSGF